MEFLILLLPEVAELVVDQTILMEAEVEVVLPEQLESILMVQVVVGELKQRQVEEELHGQAFLQEDQQV
jgi:hypothetical protein